MISCASFVEKYWKRALLPALRAAAVFTLAVGGSGSVSAQGYPAKLITFVTPFSPGAGPDVYVRAIAAAVGQAAGVPAIVENKPGAGSMLAAQSVARATPDGYTVLITGNVAVTGNPHVVKKMLYDPVADFTPVTTLAKGPMYLYVNPKTLPVHSATELVALLRKSPGKYSFAYTSITSQLPAEVLQQSAKVKLLGVRYRSGASAIPDLISGQIDMMFTDYTPWAYVKSDKLRAIAVSDLQRSPYTPSLPTFEETGIKGMDIGFWLGAYLPAHTPAPVVARLHQLLAAAVKATDVQTASQSMGMFDFILPIGELAKYQAKESADWGRVIRSAGIQPE